MSGARARTKASGRYGHFGGWRAVTSVPAMVGSLLGMVALSRGLGRRQALVLLDWLAAGAAVFTGVGERIAVRAACRFPSAHPLAGRGVSVALGDSVADDRDRGERR